MTNAQTIEPRGWWPWFAILGLVGLLLALMGASAVAETIRFVPQLGLSNLDPTKVALGPADGTRLLVVNVGGRIDLLDIANPDRPIKTAEIQAGALEAAFNPAGDRIVSAGDDGMVRLWHLNGTSAAEPFEGHDGTVWSVAFNLAGDYIWSATPVTGLRPLRKKQSMLAS